MNLQSLQTNLLLFWEKLRSIQGWSVWAAAAFLGLAIAKFLLALTMFILNKYIPFPDYAAMAGSSTIASNRAQILDPTTIVGGPLFPSAVLEPSTTQNNSAVPVDDVKFKLIGTLEGHPSFARAVLVLATNPPETKEYAMGAKIGISRISYIGREYIWIRRGSQRIKMKVGESIDDVAQRLQAEASTKAETTQASAGVITKVISREEVNKTILGNPAEIYKGASFGPIVENSKITGYKIHKVKDSHVFFKLGARPGDILRKVNGYGLEDTERMFELWRSIKTAPSVKVEIERNGKPVTYDFQIRN